MLNLSKDGFFFYEGGEAPTLFSRIECLRRPNIRLFMGFFTSFPAVRKKDVNFKTKFSTFAAKVEEMNAPVLASVPAVKTTKKQFDWRSNNRENLFLLYLPYFKNNIRLRKTTKRRIFGPSKTPQKRRIFGLRKHSNGG